MFMSGNTIPLAYVAKKSANPAVIALNLREERFRLLEQFVTHYTVERKDQGF